ncbi:TatD family hydrolase [Thermoplasma sp.]|uniref:TatD family hydrolase n=1 Tax=Thermoplasma sp. TaxID=1973142 RepID=UPI00127F8098|nr:TatD family hydrolase [Thermoplasma sp.]KAA8922708.1 MAG: metal-dependent hydrolase [Thermoplasma sp.]
MEKYSGRIFDNHFHLNPGSDFVNAVRIFRRSGGTSLNITNLPMHDTIDEYYQRLYDETVRMAKIVESETGVETLVTIGPYPFDYFFFESAGTDPVSIMQKGFDLAARYVEDGKADAIGEIGFPHVPQQEAVMQRFWEMLDYAMNVAHDAGSPIVIHTFDLSCKDYERIEKLADSHGSIAVVKHHARPADLSCMTRIVRSVPASRSAVRESLAISRDFLLETDFINDPVDMNKFLPPDSVPKRAQMIIQENEDGPEILNRIFNTLPESVYARLRERRL